MKSENSSREMARPLGVRGHQKPSNEVASFKAGGKMFVENPTEHTTMLSMDVDPRTCDIIPQPFTVRLDLEIIFPTQRLARKAEPRVPKKKATSGLPHEERIYTPDFEVALTNKTSLIVESKSNIEIAKISVELERRERILNNLGYRYLVVSSTEVQHKGLHSNLVNLRDAMRFRSRNDTGALIEEFEKLIVNRRGKFSFGEIRNQTSDLALYLGLISGVVGCDLRAGHFGNSTQIWQAHGDLAHLQLLRLES